MFDIRSKDKQCNYAYLYLQNKYCEPFHFLAKGENFRSLLYQFRIHNSTITKFYPQVFRTTYTVLKGVYLKYNFLDSTSKRFVMNCTD